MLSCIHSGSFQPHSRLSFVRFHRLELVSSCSSRYVYGISRLFVDSLYGLAMPKLRQALHYEIMVFYYLLHWQEMRPLRDLSIC